MKKSYGESLRTMDAHVDRGSNPNEMAERFINYFNQNQVHYRVGLLCKIFYCFEKTTSG
jgi:hypothetical protein